MERYTEKSCQTHGLTKFVWENRGYYRCMACRTSRVAEQRRVMKQALVEEAGGKCQICTYDAYIGGLDFHHLIPSEKSYGLGCRGLTRAYALLRQEARKCILLCCRCHREVEAGLVSCQGIVSLIPDVQPYGTPGKRVDPSLKQMTIRNTGKVNLRKSYVRKTKIVWPSHEVLAKMVAESNYSAVGRVLGVSDNAIRKRLKKMACAP